MKGIYTIVLRQVLAAAFCLLALLAGCDSNEAKTTPTTPEAPENPDPDNPEAPMPEEPDNPGDPNPQNPDEEDPPTPPPSGAQLKVAYIYRQGTQPLAGYRERLTGVMSFLRDYLADELEYHGFARKEMGLNFDTDGMLHIDVIERQRTSYDNSRTDGSLTA